MLAASFDENVTQMVISLRQRKATRSLPTKLLIISKEVKLYQTDKKIQGTFDDEDAKRCNETGGLEAADKPNNEEISFLYTKDKKKFKKKELKEVIDKITYTAFYKINKITDNKELKAAGNQENLGKPES